MKMEIEIDESLFHLEGFLVLIDCYEYDNDITEKLRELRQIVTKKLYSKLHEVNEDILTSKMKMVVEFEKFEQI